MRSRQASDEVILGRACRSKVNGVVIISMSESVVNAVDAESEPLLTARTNSVNVKGAESCFGTRTVSLGA